MTPFTGDMQYWRQFGVGTNTIAKNIPSLLKFLFLSHFKIESRYTVYIQYIYNLNHNQIPFIFINSTEMKLLTRINELLTL